MKITFSINKIFKDLWIKAFIFVILFNSFYVSICNKIGLSAFMNSAFIAIIIFGAYVSGQIKLYLKDVLAYIGIVILFLFNIVMFNVRIDDYIISFFVSILVMMVLSGSIDFERFQTYICNTSCIYIVILFMYIIISYSRSVTIYSGSDRIDLMGFAYYIIPSIMIVVYNYLRHRRLIYLTVALIGALYLLICGTRGPILCFAVFAMFCIWHELRYGSMKSKKMILYGILFLAFFLIILPIMCVYLYPIFQKNGFSTRWMLYFMDGADIFDLSGREGLYLDIVKSIMARPIFGHGLLEDRSINGGLYSHNLILEVVNAFGMLIGSVLLLALFALVSYSYSIVKSDVYKYYIAIYVCASIIKLMFSSSFLHELSLYILIGICFAAIRNRGNNTSVICSK